MKYRGIDDVKELKRETKIRISKMLIDAWNYIDVEHDILVEEFGLMATQNIEMKVSRRLTKEALLKIGADEKAIDELLDTMDRDMRGEWR